VAQIAHSGETTLQIFASELRAPKDAFTGRHCDCKQQRRSKITVVPARTLLFCGHSYVEKQVGVTVNQPRHQGCAAQINSSETCRCMRLHLGRRTNLLDLAVFNQDRRGGKHVSSARIEQSAGLYQSDDGG
jgi:hypothetical protein